MLWYDRKLRRSRYKQSSTRQLDLAQWNRQRLPACSPGSIPDQISTLFSIYILSLYLSFELECEKNENEQKEARIGPFKKTHLSVTRS